MSISPPTPRGLVLAALCLVMSSVQGQTPSLSQVEAQFNFFHNYLDVSYTLSGDTARVYLQVSEDGGLTHLVPLDSLTGDTGRVAPGAGRMIRWVAPGALNLLQTRVRLVALSEAPVDIAALVAQVDSQRLRDNLAWLAQPRHALAAPGGLAAIKDSLEARYLAAGVQTERQELVLFGGYRLENILGRQPGLLRERETWVVDGHFDAVAQTPGADDNASAVAALLEIQRVLSAYLSEATIRYIAFDQEEAGLLGSIHYVGTVGPPPYEEIAGVLNMEMIGYYDASPGSQSLPLGFNLLFPAAYAAVAADSFRGNFLTVVGNGAAQPLNQALAQAAATYVPALRVVGLTVPGNGSQAPDLRRSDHAPFWD
ncbi:MAG: M28 family peptidase, partial [Bacteroidetes bacterium]